MKRKKCEDEKKEALVISKQLQFATEIESMEDKEARYVNLL